MDHVLEPESDSISTTSNPEAAKIQRNSLYLTFNAPQVDEYHRGIFLTHPPVPTAPEPRYSGTLFHASYSSPSDPNSPDEPLPASWHLEQRTVKDVSTSHSLVLLYRIGTLDSTKSSIETQFQCIRRVLEAVPLGREKREREIGPLEEGEGNQVLDGYDCVIWTKDALNALANAGLININGQPVDRIMASSRAMAGPKDARTMVGVDFGGFRVFN